jgi:hypothetical protein
VLERDVIVGGLFVYYANGNYYDIIDCAAVHAYYLLGLNTAYFPREVGYGPIRYRFDQYARLALEFAAYRSSHVPMQALSLPDVERSLTSMLQEQN